MIKKLICSFILAFSLLACNDDNPKVSTQPEGDVDAARLFIRSALDGNYKEAQKLVLQDSTNLGGLANAEILYLKKDITTQRGLRESSIIFHNTNKLNDSVSIIEFSNSFTKQKQSVKAVKQNGQWLIDFKYNFQNTDSTGK
jgi:hypothetical protein